MANEQTTRSRVSVQFSRKFNLGSYESLGVEVGAWDDCKEKETVKAGIERLAVEVQGQFELLCGKIEGNKKGRK